jgi:hypothetical protein
MEASLQVSLASSGQEALKATAFGASQLLSRISLRIGHRGKNNLPKTKLRPGLFAGFLSIQILRIKMEAKK